jgi:hypothetical protein
MQPSDMSTLAGEVTAAYLAAMELVLRALPDTEVRRGDGWTQAQLSGTGSRPGMWCTG